MPDITIELRDGKVREFKERGRPGGSYCNRLRYELGFVVHVDEWDNETAIPTDLIQEIKVNNLRRGW